MKKAGVFQLLDMKIFILIQLVFFLFLYIKCFLMDVDQDQHFLCGSASRSNDQSEQYGTLDTVAFSLN
jgi:hypothetical protein